MAISFITRRGALSVVPVSHVARVLRDYVAESVYQVVVLLPGLLRGVLVFPGRRIFKDILLQILDQVVQVLRDIDMGMPALCPLEGGSEVVIDDSDSHLDSIERRIEEDSVLSVDVLRSLTFLIFAETLFSGRVGRSKPHIDGLGVLCLDCLRVVIVD
jgi:hypothetical protein